MADEHFDEIVEVRLPAKLFRRSVGIAFDVGGARCKVAFKKQAEKCTSDVSDGHVTVVLAAFSLNKLAEALDFVKNNADYSLEQTADGHQRQLRVTGVFYSQKFASTVETELNLSAGSVVYAAEFGMQASAISILRKNLSEDDLFYTPPPSPRISSEDSTEKVKCLSISDEAGRSLNGTSTSTKSGSDITPGCEASYLILCYGSGIGITLVSKDGESELINGSAEGGMSLLAMSKLLAGTDDFAEFMALAERGNVAKVSTTAEDCQHSGARYFDNFPDDAVVHAFGKVLKPDFNAKPEDMARTILMNAMENTASLTVWTALARGCRTVYICGGVFEHQLPREHFFRFLEGLALMYGKTVMTGRALKYGSFLPVLGAILDDCVSTNNEA